MKIIAVIMLAALLLIGGNLYAGDLSVGGTFSVVNTQGTVSIGAGGVTFPDGSKQTTATRLAWEYIATAPTATAISGTLDGNADGGYEFEFLINRGANGTARFVINGDTTPGNYLGGVINLTGTTVSGTTAQSNTICAFSNANDKAYLTGNISITQDGFVTIYAISDQIVGNVRYTRTYTTRYTVHVTNLTSIGVNGSIASTIGANSRFRLWRKK